MKFDWDISELTDFGEYVSDYSDIEPALMGATREIAKVLHRYLLIQTPVQTGNLRKMWSAGDNLRFTVEKAADGYFVTFINEARAKSENGFMYGAAVNDGHKTPNGGGWVMGRFFVEKAMLQTVHSSEIERIICNELQKWWDSL